MNKLYFSTAFFLFSLSLLAQKEDYTHCSKRLRYQNSSLKSNTLNLAQIAETEEYDVHFYALDIAMNNLVKDVAGTVEIHGSARVDMDSILFELFESLAITEIRLNTVPTPFNRIGSAVKLPAALTQGDFFVVAVDYAGTPPSSASNPLGGNGMTNATSPSWGNQVTYSLSEPFSAYEWFPCKQSLKDKADSCSVKVTVPSTCKAGSNGLLENEVDLGNGTTRFEWMHRHPIDYYLISVSVGQYVDYSIYANPAGAPGPLLIQNYIYDNPSTLPFFQADIDETIDFMELLADLYGPYPFDDEKYGHCMAPLSGGMEHQTMTTQGFFNKGLTTHELGHQWWGDNVTCASWADIWLNEGFASYTEYLMLENLYPAEKDQHMIDVHDNVKSAPWGSVWVLDSLNTGRIFDGRLTYDKGSAIIHTFRFMLNNDSQFFQILKDFQQDFADSTAYGVDFRDALQTGSGVDFTEAFNEWYFGEGYPIYSAKWNVIGSDLHLEVAHLTSSTTPTFTNPLELRFSRLLATDTIIRVPVTGNVTQYIIPGMSNVANLTQIDPNNWIINSVGSITHDTGFIAGLQEQETELMLIYPNPTSDELSISMKHIGLYEIVLYDMTGKKLRSMKFDQHIELDLSEHANSSYLIEVSASNGTKWRKAIVKN